MNNFREVFEVFLSSFFPEFIALEKVSTEESHQLADVFEEYLKVRFSNIYEVWPSHIGEVNMNKENENYTHGFKPCVEPIFIEFTESLIPVIV